MGAIIEKNIDMARSQIHGTNARRWAAKMMTGGIARRISFGLDDSPVDASSRKIVDHHFADQESSEFDGVFGKLGTPNPADGDSRPRLLERGHP